MADKYKGPERRTINKEPTRRTNTINKYERRLVRDYDPGRSVSNMVIGPLGAPSHSAEIIDIKEHAPGTERRMHGAGRRKGDLARALKTGEPAIYQVGKGAWKSTGKLAKKAAKKLPVIGTAIGIYDLVNRNKQ